MIETVDIRAFDGPLDLLNHLIDQNRFNWFDIPIADITRQYLAVIQQAEELDMQLAGEFLVMAATLIHIKSKLLLPSSKLMDEDAESDPREALILQLLAYRRCKWVAQRLMADREHYDMSFQRPPMTAKSLGIRVVQPLSQEVVEPGRLSQAFFEAVKALQKRNSERYHDLSEKMVHLLKRDRVSLPEKIRSIWRAVVRRSRVFFGELFDKNTSKAEKVTGFIALLELVRRQYVTAKQTTPFAPIAIEKDPQASNKGDILAKMKDLAHEYD